MKTVSNIYALISLVIANLVPLYGVWYWDWNVFSLMLLYWFESAIIGYFTVQKMLKSEGSVTIKNGVAVNDFGASAFLVPFFTLHFGLFMFVHLIFVLAFFYSSQILWWGLLISAASLCFSHAVSYQLNFIQGGEFKRTSAEQLFIRPYPRIIVMHLTVILGGALSLGYGQPVWAMTILVGLKIVADVFSHLWEHGWFGKNAMVMTTV